MSSHGVVDPEHLPEGLLHELQTEILQTQEDRVRAMLTERRAVLEEMAHVLVDAESLEGDQLRSWLAERATAAAS